MEVILLKDVKGSGKAGSVIKVKDGYAVNYLIPKGLAKEANEKNMKAHSIEVEKKLELEKQREKEASQLAEKIKKADIVVKVKAGTKGRIFGSVTSMSISDALKEKGFSVDKKLIDLEHPIKEIGVSKVKLNLHSKHRITIDVKIEEL
ncbi:MAG: 50S ribosomal protein L9 [Clostridiales bacterium]|nr:MAG: 50S ribosomal protein L9 [Clostridiales bacterium]